MEFQERVLAADYEAQRNIAPFLEVPVLRKIVQTLTNDPRGDFGQWATNPLIIGMLRDAKKALDEGRFTEEEAERMILDYVKARSRRRSTDAGAPSSGALSDRALQRRLLLSLERVQVGQ